MFGLRLPDTLLQVLKNKQDVGTEGMIVSVEGAFRFRDCVEFIKIKTPSKALKNQWICLLKCEGQGHLKFQVIHWAMILSLASP